MAAIQRTVSIGSLSSITSEESNTKNKKPTSVTIGFKYSWFETTLNFIKDDRRLSLNYGVTPAQAIFIRDMLSFEVNPSIRLQKYAPLYEAFKIFGLKYNFKLSRLNKDIIVLQKIPKEKPVMPPGPKPLTSQMERQKKVIDRISKEYMVEKAQTILDFIDDPTRASLEFKNVMPLEAMFLQSVMTAARPLFPEHAEMLQHLKKLKPNLDFSLQVSVGKINKKTNERTVNFRKDPKFGKKAKRDRENSLNRSNIPLTKSFVPSKEQPKIQTQNIIQNKENSTQNLNSMETGQDTQNSMQNAQNSMQNAQNSMQNEQNSMKALQNHIQIEQIPMQVDQACAEPMDVDSPRSIGSMNSGSAASERSEHIQVGNRTRSASVMVQRTGPSLGSVNYGSQNNLNLQDSTSNTHVSRRDFTGLNSRKKKLLEAMSTPVELDKPARMMQKMGWAGGPLGIRGIGITEPIIPALDLVSGAGLGHVEPVKPAKAKAEVVQVMHKPNLQNFRQELLETILDLLYTDKVTVSLVYPNAMGKKDISFVRRAVTNFSERRNICLKNVEQVRLAHHIIGALQQLPNVVIHGAVDEYKKQITLKKVLIVRPELNLPLLPQTGVVKVEHLLNLADSVDGYRYAYDTHKQKKYLGTRITVLIEILHFLQFNDQFKKIVFEAALSKQEIVYVTKAVQSLNRQKKPPMCPARTLEDDICSDIHKVIGDKMLVVKFADHDCAVLLEKVLVMEMQSSQDCLMKAINTNTNAVKNINVVNENKPNNSAIAKLYPLPKTANASNNVNTPNNIVVAVQEDVIRTVSKDLNNKKIAITVNNDSGVSRVDDMKVGENKTLNDANVKKDSDYMNKILAERLEALGEPLNDNALKELPSEDDDVMIIEPVREIIVISDDEFDDKETENKHNAEENTKNIDKSVKKDQVLEKQALNDKTSNVNVNADVSITPTDSQDAQKDTDSNVTQFSADMNISNSQGDGEIDITRGSADMTISNSQCIEDVDTTIIPKDTETEVTNECAIVSNSQNNNASDVLKESENVDLAKDNAEKSSAEIQNSVKLDVPNIQENAKIATAKKTANISIDFTLDVSIADKWDASAREKTDINKSIVKIEPKKEKLTYSEEFDKDLHELEQVLLLDDDDDVFDYTIVKTEKRDSTDWIDRPSSKRSRSDSVESSPDNSKKTKVFTFKNSKNILIVPKDYSDVQITKECTIKIQTVISDAIEKCKELPLLKCHGIQDGGLFYSCHNEQSLFFVENCMSVISDYKIISDVTIKKKPYNIKIRLNSLLDNTKTLFSRLELYNAGLITDSWVVKETEKFEDYIVIYVDIDEYSYKYICDSSFCLYAGIDEARFSVVWD